VSLIDLADYRARGLPLPADDTVAQRIIDGVEARLAREIGPLTGSRTETFFVSVASSAGRLGLRRYTSAVEVIDGALTGGSPVDADSIRLVANGSAVIRSYVSSFRWWNGPYVRITYTPNDQTEVEDALFGLVSLSIALPTGLQSEQIGSYSYRTGGGTGQGPGVDGQRAAIISGLLPKHDQLTTLAASRPVRFDLSPAIPDDPGDPVFDPVINRPEPIW